MNNFGISSSLTGPARTYPQLPAASTITPGSSASDIGASEPNIEPLAADTNAADEPAANDQSEQQAQIQRRLSQVEAELLRVTQTEIRELASRDREVRTHEQAHKAVGGQYAGAISYSYERGPDGRMYAVGGSVAIDTAAVPGDPAATLQKLQQVQRAALAPAQPSAQDLSVAAQAAQAMAQARSELATESLDAATGKDDAKAESQDRTPANTEADKGIATYRQVATADSSTAPSLQAQA